MSSNTDKEEGKEIRVFQLNDEKAEFEELEIDENVNLDDILDSELVLYFVKPSKFKSFIWAGSEASTRMKFIAAKTAAKVRDSIGPAISINTVDEGDETNAFKVLMGWIEPESEEYEQTGPIYEGKMQDDELLQELPLDKLTAVLEKVGIPEGYRREFVIAGKEIYAYQEYYNQYMGEIIKERRLHRLGERVPDGPYKAADLVPRVVMRFNQVLYTELLKPLTEEEIEEQEEIEQKIYELEQPDKPFVQ